MKTKEEARVYGDGCFVKAGGLEQNSNIVQKLSRVTKKSGGVLYGIIHVHECCAQQLRMGPSYAGSHGWDWGIPQFPRRVHPISLFRLCIESYRRGSHRGEKKAVDG